MESQWEEGRKYCIKSYMSDTESRRLQITVQFWLSVSWSSRRLGAEEKSTGKFLFILHSYDKIGKTAKNGRKNVVSQEE